MKGITRDCIVEMFDRKTIYIFLVVTGITILITLFTPRPNIEIQMSGNAEMDTMVNWLHNPATKALSIFLSFMVFLTVLATAGLIPNMLGKGRADFFLSRPISRSALLINKITGIWVVYGSTLVLCGIVSYAVMLVVGGTFDGKVIYLFALNLISFLIWLSITSTAGIISGSGSLSIMTALMVWAAQAILVWHQQIKDLIDSRIFGYALDITYYIVPKTGEINNLTDSLALGKTVESWMPLYSSLIFSIVIVFFAVVVFKRKNY